MSLRSLARDCSPAASARVLLQGACPGAVARGRLGKRPAWSVTSKQLGFEHSADVLADQEHDARNQASLIGGHTGDAGGQGLAGDRHGQLVSLEGRDEPGEDQVLVFSEGAAVSYRARAGTPGILVASPHVPAP